MATSSIAYAAPPPPTPSAVVQGFGDGVPLSFVVSQIVPSGYTVGYAKSVDKAVPISWHGGSGDWLATLKDVAAQHHLAVEVSGKSIILQDVDAAYEGPAPVVAMPPVAPPSPPVHVAASPLVPVAPAKPMAPAPVAVVAPPVAKAVALPPSAPAPATPPAARHADVSGVWKAKTGETLEQVLGDWCDRAGWTLVYQSKMVYELQAGAEFEGDFISSASSLVRSIRALPLPNAKFYSGNKVLLVTNHFETN